MKGILSLRGFRKLRTGAIVATGVFLFATSNGQLVQASEEDGVWEARTVEQVKADIASLAKDSNYVIKWGDTLSVISEATGISMDALAQMNQITNINLIYAHNELGFTQPISTTTGNQTVSKQTVTVVNRQNSQEEVKAFEVTTKEDTRSGKTETVVTEVKPNTKEEIPVPKTEQAAVVTGKEEAAKVNQTLVSSQPTEKQSTIGKAETPKVDQTPTTTAKVEAKKADQAPAVVNPAETPVTTETKETTTSKSTEEKKQTEGTVPKETTEGKLDSKEATLPTEKTSKGNTTSEVAPMPAAESEGKAESSVPTTNGEENTTVEKKPEPKTDQALTAVNPTETPVATETKETTPSKPTEEKKQTEGTTPKEPTEGKVDSKEAILPTEKPSKDTTSEKTPMSPTPAAESEGKAESPAPTANGEESTIGEKKTEPKADQASAVVKPAETPVTPVTTETKETTPSKPTEEKEDKQIEQPTINTPSKDSVEDNTIAPSTNNSSDEGGKHEEEKKNETVVPEEATKENKEALESHKQNKLNEINKSSLSPEQKEQAISKVKELTANAEKAIEGAATSEDQAKVVDQYENDLAAIETPNVETPKPDFTKPVESHNPTGSTTIGEGGAISTLASSTPAASTPAVSESAANTPVVSEPVVPSAPAESAPATSVPTASAPATSAPATGEPAASTSEASAPAISTPSTGAPAASTSTTTNPSASDTSTSNTSPEHTGFRNAPVYQPRVIRRARSVDAPKDQIAIYYNFTEMKDIAGFLGDPGDSIVTVPAGATSDQVRTIVKDKIDAKKAELAKRGYTFMDDYFVDKPQEDTIRYDYVVNFTKAASASTSEASAPVTSTSVTSASAPTTPVVSDPVAPSVPAKSAPTIGEPAASAPATSTPSTGAPTASTSTTTNPSVSDTSTSNTSPEHTGFRNAPVYQPRVIRRARSVDAPKDQIAIYYNFTEMKDIAGFLGDPGDSIVTVPAGATSDQVRTIVKDKIDAKKAELAKRGYTFMDDYFVDKPQEDTIRYDYVVNFTKAASLRVAPVSQPRAARNRRSVVESPVKTRTITFYYQLAGLEIAGALGTPGKNYVITVPETASAAEIQQAIDDATRSEKAELGRYFKYVRETNLQTDILDRGFGNFDYVITFTR